MLILNLYQLKTVSFFFFSKELPSKFTPLGERIPYEKLQNKRKTKKNRAASTTPLIPPIESKFTKTPERVRDCN